MQKTQEMCIWSLGWEDALEEGMANHSSIFAWRVPRAEEPVRLRSMGLQRVRYNWSDLACGHLPSLPLFLPSSPLGGAVPLGQVLANKKRFHQISAVVGFIFLVHLPLEPHFLLLTEWGIQWRGLLIPWLHTRKPKADLPPTRWPGAAFLSIIHQPAPQSVERQLQTPPHTPPQVHWQWSSKGWALKSSVLGTF